MSGKKIITIPYDIIYYYDGSLAGFFCCVYESVYSKQMPINIIPEHDTELSLFEEKYIELNVNNAKKVRDSISEKISTEALRLIKHVFLSCLKQKEMVILRFLLMAYEEGAKTLRMLYNPDVDALLKAQKRLLGEQHLLLGFVRFSDYNGKLVSTITPNNFILPFIADHFINRFSNEDFMIYDKTHKVALIYENREKHFVQLEYIESLEVSDTEEQYRALWKRFYKTIAIEERYNPKCRSAHMPKRYWDNMTEMKELL